MSSSLDQKVYLNRAKCIYIRFIEILEILNRLSLLDTDSFQTFNCSLRLAAVTTASVWKLERRSDCSTAAQQLSLPSH